MSSAAMIEPNVMPFAWLEARAQELSEQGPEWLRTLRARGLGALRASGLPSTKHEEWRYLPLRTLLKHEWSLAPEAVATFSEWFSEESVRIELVNGRVQSAPEAVAGLSVSGLDEEFGALVPVESHPFAALATGLTEQGVRVHIQGEVEALIEVAHFVSEGAATPRMRIELAPGAKAKLVETYTSAPAVPTLTLPITEVVLGEGAHFEHVRVQRESLAAFHIGQWQARQEAGSEYYAYNVVLGGGIARLDQGIFLAGENITTRMDGVVAAKAEQIVDNHTRLDHAMPNCNSFEIYKHILDDKSTGVFNGKIYVHPDAQKTDAKQTNQTLLLSREAEINSKPQLEIFADDVKCTHGATVGQLEETPLFYLRSRGIPKEQAEGLLVYAFAAEVLELISIEPVRVKLEQLLFQHLAG